MDKCSWCGDVYPKDKCSVCSVCNAIYCDKKCSKRDRHHNLICAPTLNERVAKVLYLLDSGYELVGVVDYHTSLYMDNEIIDLTLSHPDTCMICSGFLGPYQHLITNCYANTSRGSVAIQTCINCTNAVICPRKYLPEHSCVHDAWLEFVAKLMMMREYICLNTHDDIFRCLVIAASVCKHKCTSTPILPLMPTANFETCTNSYQHPYDQEFV